MEALTIIYALAITAGDWLPAFALCVTLTALLLLAWALWLNLGRRRHTDEFWFDAGRESRTRIGRVVEKRERLDLIIPDE